MRTTMCEPPKYVYKPVVCTACGWTGRRGLRVTWPACPRCVAPAWYIRRLDGERPRSTAALTELETPKEAP
jgi:hypothetical protein